MKLFYKPNIYPNEMLFYLGLMTTERLNALLITSLALSNELPLEDLAVFYLI